MHPMIERCAGLDVHQATVMATVRIPDGQGGRQVITETFGTTTAALLTLRETRTLYSFRGTEPGSGQSPGLVKLS